MDLGQALVNFAASMTGVLWRLLWALGALIGTVYCGNILMKAHQASANPGHHQVTGVQIFGGLVIAALVVNLSQLLSATAQSSGMGMLSFGPISYAGGGTYGQLAPVVNAALTLASVAGGYFGLKGVMTLFRATVQGQSSHGAEDHIWRGMTHLIGGAALVGIDQLVEAVRQSVGVLW